MPHEYNGTVFLTATGKVDVSIKVKYFKEAENDFDL